MRGLEWDNMGVKVDSRYLHDLRFTGDIVLMKSSINQAEPMLAEFDETCKKIGLQLNLDKTTLMRNGWVSDAPFTINGTNVPECSSCVYHIHSWILTFELGRRKRAAWGTFKSIEDVMKRTKNIQLRAHHFNTAVLPAIDAIVGAGVPTPFTFGGWRWDTLRF
ncbi:hypothetical protein RB195_018600 [Necator americanus]|uniref:Reverse transcriptase domain-containing protein n=1 Tax=Necator americanus TaxID=51031 RepID=A0ABR1CDB8_NECAM